jgi:hypothetical protein
MLVAESEGNFGSEEWDKIAQKAEDVCRVSNAKLRGDVGK